MTRMQTAATSLVAAIPAGILAALLVMAFLGSSENLTGMVPILVGITLLCAAVVAALPFGILIFSGKSKRQIREEIAASQAVPTQVVDDDDSEMTTGDEIVTLDEEATEEIEETVDFDSAQLSDVADFDTELEDVSDEDLFAEDEPPKKKKLK